MSEQQCKCLQIEYNLYKFNNLVKSVNKNCRSSNGNNKAITAVPVPTGAHQQGINNSRSSRTEAPQPLPHNHYNAILVSRQKESLWSEFRKHPYTRLSIISSLPSDNQIQETVATTEPSGQWPLALFSTSVINLYGNSHPHLLQGWHRFLQDTLQANIIFPPPLCICSL